jgi:hypothetical protein
MEPAHPAAKQREAIRSVHEARFGRELRGSQHKHHLPSREEDRFQLHQGEEEMANAEEAEEKVEEARQAQKAQ